MDTCGGLDFISDEIYFCFLFFLSSQNKLLNTRAFGGAAGSGRTYLVLLEVLLGRHLHANPIDKYGV